MSSQFISVVIDEFNNRHIDEVIESLVFHSTFISKLPSAYKLIPQLHSFSLILVLMISKILWLLRERTLIHCL